MLRTRAPLVVANPFDLHVLGPPQTFALSQDQTLQFESARQIRRSGNRPCPSGPASGCESLRSSLSHKRSCKTLIGVSLLGLLFLSPVFRGRPTRPSRCFGLSRRADRLLSRPRLVKLSCRDFSSLTLQSPAICPVLRASPAVVTFRFRPAGSGEAVFNLVGSPRQVFFQTFFRTPHSSTCA